MSLTSYRAAPPRDKLGRKIMKERARNLKENPQLIRLVDLAATYSPAS